jgi:hypothetical protein
MSTSSRELTNIPISVSLLYEKEYKNLCIFLSLKKNKDKLRKRRAFTDVNNYVKVYKYSIVNGVY